MVQLINPNVKMIEASTKARADKCTKEIEKILRSFDCVLVPSVQIVGTQIFGQVLIQAQERKLDA